MTFKKPFRLIIILWFEKLLGFKELSPSQVRENITLNGQTITSHVNNKSFDCGVLDKQIEQLFKACAGHTGGINAADITIATCWDADRLDLGRVGVDPDPAYLFTDEAKRIAETGDLLQIK